MLSAVRTDASNVATGILGLRSFGRCITLAVNVSLFGGVGTVCLS